MVTCELCHATVERNGMVVAFLACEPAHLWVRSLVRKRQDCEPATISVKFSFLRCLNNVKYHWPKSAKGDKTVNHYV